MKKLFVDFIQFLKTGKTEYCANKLSQNIFQLGKLFLLFEILFFASLLATVICAAIFDFPRNHTLKWIRSLSPLWAFLIPNIIGPLLEEFTYRFWLRATKFTLTFSSLFITYTLINNFLRSSYYSLQDTFLIEVSLSAGIAVLVFIVLSFEGVFVAVQIFWKQNARLLIYISILSFGFSHITNFPLQGWQFLYAPTMVLPQLVMGAVWAFGRVKYGILFPIVIHIIHNAIL